MRESETERQPVTAGESETERQTVTVGESETERQTAKAGESETERQTVTVGESETERRTHLTAIFPDTLPDISESILQCLCLRFYTIDVTQRVLQLLQRVFDQHLYTATLFIDLHHKELLLGEWRSQYTILAGNKEVPARGSLGLSLVS